MQDFSKLVAPMTKLTQKGVKFQWDDTCEKSIHKARLVFASVLVILERDLGYTTFYDASYLQYEGVLMRLDKVIAYASR